MGVAGDAQDDDDDDDEDEGALAMRWLADARGQSKAVVKMLLAWTSGSTATPVAEGRGRTGRRRLAGTRVRLALPEVWGDWWTRPMHSRAHGSRPRRPGAPALGPLQAGFEEEDEDAGDV